MTQATIKVVMLKDDEGYPNGHTLVKYEKGKEYALPASLAECFFQTNSADPAEAHAAADKADGGKKPAPKKGAKVKEGEKDEEGGKEGEKQS